MRILFSVFTILLGLSCHAAPTCEGLFSVLPSPTDRLKGAETFVLPMGPGRLVAVQYVKPADSTHPTFILMPGVNRAFEINEPGPLSLIAQGFGVASLTFSTQPHAIALLDAKERPYFEKTQPTLQDFANEVSTVAAELTKRGESSALIPVSLSFSGSVSPYLQGFPLVIDSAPLTDEAAANAEGPRARRMIRGTQIFNPIFGEAVARTMINAGYEMVWKGQAANILKLFPNLPASRESDFIKGYSAMSRAQEDKSWANAPDSPAGTRRMMMIGSEESPSLLKNQLESFDRLHAARPESVLFVINGAEHNIPSSTPSTYAALLAVASQSGFMPQGGIVLVTPPTKESAGGFSPVMPDHYEEIYKELLRAVETMQKGA